MVLEINIYMPEETDDIDKLMAEFRATKSLTGITATSQSIPQTNQLPAIASTTANTLSTNNLQEYIFEKSSNLIQNGLATIDRLQSTTTSGATPETIEAYAKLISSVSSALDILNKINIQNIKDKTAKDIKKIEHDASANMLNKFSAPQVQNNTIIVATREEMLNKLAEKASELAKPTINVTPNQ